MKKKNKEKDLKLLKSAAAKAKKAGVKLVSAKVK